jgi:hypothetical protein
VASHGRRVAWRGYNRTDPDGWTFADGTISKTRGTCDIVSRDEFGNFELELEWKIGKAGNSGIFYPRHREYDHIYWTRPSISCSTTRTRRQQDALTRARRAYGLYRRPTGIVKPVGEWNTTRIVVERRARRALAQRTELVEYELNSPDWKAKVGASKFKDWPHYGLAKKGHIGIQGDHPGTLEIRNIRIRELP